MRMSYFGTAVIWGCWRGWVVKVGQVPTPQLQFTQIPSHLKPKLLKILIYLIVKHIINASYLKPLLNISLT